MSDFERYSITPETAGLLSAELLKDPDLFQDAVVTIHDLIHSLPPTEQTHVLGIIDNLHQNYKKIIDLTNDLDTIPDHIVLEDQKKTKQIIQDQLNKESESFKTHLSILFNGKGPEYETFRRSLISHLTQRLRLGLE